ncbi:hypothetical protein TRVL_00474 [Trypanosoma vivax]|nr:hypothetical protein TRVL_00474 [Trypanosoma vivax]
MQRERAQVVVCGQRFEATVEILSSSCVLFRHFFRAVAEELREAGSSNALSAAGSGANITDNRRNSIDCSTQYKAAAQEVVAWCNSNDVPGMAVPAQLAEWDSRTNMWRFVYTDKGLTPADVGVIFVYIRKLFQWRSSNGDNINDKHGKPELPIRWNEMPHDMQLAVARVVCTFGVEPLIGCYGRPTAVADTEGSAMSGISADTRGTGGQFLSPLEKAEAYLRERSAQHGAHQTTQREERRGPHASMCDENLLLETVACTRCGVTGHRDDSCPH